MSNQIVYLNEGSFDSTIKSATKPVLVDFWADWCGPCKMLAPILDDIAASYGDKVVIAKLNVDENPSISPKFGIRGIPTLLLFKNGEVVATQIGALSKLQLQTFLDNNI